MADIPSQPANQDGIAPHGARITQTYLVRNQECVAVNKTDLDELLTFDAVQQGLLGCGLFLLSGGTWLGIEKGLEQDPFSFTPVISFCFFAGISGAALVVAGFVLWVMRRSKIRKIFSETDEVG